MAAKETKKGKVIPVKQADDMILFYQKHCKDQNLPKEKSTEYVSYALPEFQAWLTAVTPYSDEVRVCLGVYPPGHPEEGRLTVLFRSYSAGKPSAEPREEGKGGTGGGFSPYDEGNSGP